MIERKREIKYACFKVSEKFDSTDVLFYHAAKKAEEVLGLKKGDSIVMTGGRAEGKSGNTNIIKVETIQ